MRAALTNEIDYQANYKSGDPQGKPRDRRRANSGAAAAHSRGSPTAAWIAPFRAAGGRPRSAERRARLQRILRRRVQPAAMARSATSTPNFDEFAQQRHLVLAGLCVGDPHGARARGFHELDSADSDRVDPAPAGVRKRRDLGAVMRSLGYQTSFLYGGYGYFDNMNAYFGDNGFEVQDRRSIDKVRFENIWGVADEDSVRPLARLLRPPACDRQAVLLGHHDDVEPQAVHVPQGPRGPRHPARRRRAAPRASATPTLRSGKFLRDAREHRLVRRHRSFVVAADHGARVYGAEEIPAQDLTRSRSCIYSPKHLAPRRVDALTAQIDIAPTVLGLLGMPYEAPFFGQDSLHTPAEGRLAFFNHKPRCRDLPRRSPGRFRPRQVRSTRSATTRAATATRRRRATRNWSGSVSPISRRLMSCSRAGAICHPRPHGQAAVAGGPAMNRRVPGGARTASA